MELVRSSEYQTEIYYLVGRKNEVSSISEISEIGISPLFMKGKDQAQKKLLAFGDYHFHEYSSSNSFLQEFLSHNIDAIFIDSISHDFFLEESSNYAKMAEILETIDISIRVEETLNDVDVLTDPFHIFLSGIDTYGDINCVSRSDVNMLLTINLTANQILLTSIPRDYYVQLHDIKGYKDKLTHAGIYGIDTSVKTIEDLFGIDINYYLRVNFNTLVNLVDLIGGIEINSDSSFQAWTNPNCFIKKGKQKVNGACALAYSRERKSYVTGDRHRVLNQQEVLLSILNKLTSSNVLISNYMNILDTLSISFQTNLDRKRITSLIQFQIDKHPSWKFETQRVDGKGDYQITYSIPGMKVYVMQPEMESVKQAKFKIDMIIN